MKETNLDAFVDVPLTADDYVTAAKREPQEAAPIKSQSDMKTATLSTWLWDHQRGQQGGLRDGKAGRSPPSVGSAP